MKVEQWTEGSPRVSMSLRYLNTFLDFLKPPVGTKGRYSWQIETGCETPHPSQFPNTYDVNLGIKQRSRH